MTCFILVIFLQAIAEAKIPDQYKELANRAIQNSKRKVPKELREETQYPGQYSGPNYQFTLRKIFTNANTNDIKGFASGEKKIAIVKRKKFNIKEDYIFIDQETQTLYKLKKIIASEDNIIIYESSKTDIFSLMTNFHLHLSTDEEVPFNYSFKSVKFPRANKYYTFNWNPSSNKPIQQIINGTQLKYGYGAEANLGLIADIAFNSIKDVKIGLSINLVANIGGEVIVPSDSKVQIPDKLLLNLNYAIPGIGFSKKFLGLSINVGSFFNFTVNLTNTEVNIPIGFDYFKGYKLIGSKYFQITPNSVSDSKWKIQLLGLPEESTIGDIKNSLLSSSFKGTFNVVPSFYFIFSIGSYKLSFEVGILVPFQYDVKFDTQKCMFPYLCAKIKIPIFMFYSFSGLKVLRWNIINERSNIIPIYSFSLGPFCIVAPSHYIEGNSKFIQAKEDEKEIYYIENNDFYEQRKSGEQLQKQIRYDISNSNSKIIEQRPFTYAKYGTSPINDPVSFVSPVVPINSVLEWRLYYKNSKNEELQAKYLARVDPINISNYQYSIQFCIPIDEKQTDITCFTIKIEKCELIEPGRIFLRKWNYIAFRPEASYSGYYSTIYFDIEGNLWQNTCDYTSSSWPNIDFRQDSIYYQTDENFNIKLKKIISTTDDFSAKIEIYLNYKIGLQSKKILIGIYTTKVLTKNVDYKAEDIGLDELSFNCYAPNANESSITIGGKITYKTKGTSTINEQTIYSNGQIKTDITLADTTKATFAVEKTSPTVVSDLYQMFIPPKQELLAETIKITPKESNNITIHFKDNEMYKIIDITLTGDLNSGNNKYMLIYTEAGSSLKFLYDNDRKTLNEKCFYCYVSTLTYLSIPIRRDEFEEKSYDIRIEFFRCDNVMTHTLDILNHEEKTSIKFDNSVQSAVIIPIVENNAWFLTNGLDGEKYNQIMIIVDDETAIILRKYQQLQREGSVDFYLAYSQLPELVPSLTVDLSYMSPMLDVSHQYSHIVYSPGGYKILANNNNGDALSTVDVDKDGTAKFTLSEVGNITFVPICRNNEGMMCQITYETPTQTGFHMIRYPNKDGISTTGSGFLVELIPVVSGQSFTYYKTYEEKIEKIKEFKNDEVSMIIKIEDANNKNAEKRRICLYIENNPNEIIPFSRKYFTDNFDDLLDSLNVNKDEIGDEQMDIDENGCLLFDRNLISKTNIDSIPNAACDLPAKSITNPDYDPGASPDPTKTPYSPTSSSDVSQSLEPTSQTYSSQISYSKTYITETIITPDISFPITQSETVNPDSKDDGNSKIKIIIIIVVVALVIVISVVAVVSVICYKNKKNKNYASTSISLLDYQ